MPALAIMSSLSSGGSCSRIQIAVTCRSESDGAAALRSVLTVRGLIFSASAIASLVSLQAFMCAASVAPKGAGSLRSLFAMDLVSDRCISWLLDSFLVFIVLPFRRLPVQRNRYSRRNLSGIQREKWKKSLYKQKSATRQWILPKDFSTFALEISIWEFLCPIATQALVILFSLTVVFGSSFMGSIRLSIISQASAPPIKYIICFLTNFLLPFSHDCYIRLRNTYISLITESRYCI